MEKLQEKLNKIYPSKAPQPQLKAISTGKVVGRENLSPQAQAAIARLEAKRGLPPDMQYTRNGKKISAEEFNRTKIWWVQQKKVVPKVCWITWFLA